MQSPLHQIQVWTGSFFRRAELWEVRVYILLQHSAGPPLCAWLEFQQGMLERFQRLKDSSEHVPDSQMHDGPEDNTSGRPSPIGHSPSADFTGEDYSYAADLEIEADLTRRLDGLYQQRHGTGEYGGQMDNVLEEDDEEDHEDEDDDEPDQGGRDYMPTGLEQNNTGGETERGANVEARGDNEQGRLPDNPERGYSPEPSAVPRTDAFSNNYVRVVHTNGVHHLALVYCACGGLETTHCNLMAERLLPTSFKRYRTLFTHAVLDDFRLANLECKASAYQYFQKLWRHSSPMFPETVPNLYTELRRMSRIWRWMKKLKWAGFGHKEQETTEANPGELANFCPACPQPGINVAEGWLDDPERYLAICGRLTAT